MFNTVWPSSHWICLRRLENKDIYSQLVSQTFSDQNNVKDLMLFQLLQKLGVDETLNKLLYLSALDQDFSIQLFYDILPNKSATVSGYYDRDFDKVVIRLKEIQNKTYMPQATLMHEIAHKVIHQIFKNNVLPYNTYEEKLSYEKAIEEVLLNILSYKLINIDLKQLEFTSCMDFNSTFKLGECLAKINISPNAPYEYCVKNFITSIQEIYEGSYPSNKELIEFIVRYPQIIAMNCYHENEIVQNLSLPIKIYWDQYVDKKMDEYIEQHYDMNIIHSLTFDQI